MTRWSGYETERRPALSTKRSSHPPAAEVLSTRPQCHCSPRHSSRGSRNLRMSARKTFLLVEDDSFDAEFVENEFNQAPLHISLRAVRDGVEAMQYVEGQGEYADREKYPLPGVILLDLKMPRMDG